MIDLDNKADVDRLKDLTPEQTDRLLRRVAAAFLYVKGSRDYFMSNWYTHSPEAPSASVKYDPATDAFVMTFKRL